MDKLSNNELRLIDANTALVDKNTLLLKDIKALIRYIKNPTKAGKEEIDNMISYYEKFSTSQVWKRWKSVNI